MQIFEAQGKML